MESDLAGYSLNLRDWGITKHNTPEGVAPKHYIPMVSDHSKPELPPWGTNASSYRWAQIKMRANMM